MRIAITGHTRGLGQGIRDHLEREGLADHEPVILGFSRSNGYDITKRADRQRIVESVPSHHIFINNAYSFEEPFAQTEMLYDVFNKWRVRHEPTMILNIGSNSSDGTKNYPHRYAVGKAALDKACEQLQAIESQCRVVNIRFGLIATERIQKTGQFEHMRKLSVEDAVDVVALMLEWPQHIHAKCLTIEPKQ